MTTTFGDRDVAEALYMGEIKGTIPERFRLIGSGCYRVAYLDTLENLIYKLGAYDSNVSEAAMARYLSRKSKKGLGFDVRIPRTRTFRMKSYPNPRGYREPTCVSVQEYAENAHYTYCEAQNTWMSDVPDCNCGNDPCFAEVLEKITGWSGLDDIHAENVLVDNYEVFWLIDLAM